VPGRGARILGLHQTRNILLGHLGHEHLLPASSRHAEEPPRTKRQFRHSLRRSGRSDNNQRRTNAAEEEEQPAAVVLKLQQQSVGWPKCNTARHHRNKINQRKQIKKQIQKQTVETVQRTKNKFNIRSLLSRIKGFFYFNFAVIGNLMTECLYESILELYPYEVCKSQIIYYFFIHYKPLFNGLNNAV